MRILIIEDNINLAQNTKINLEKQGFVVDLSYDGLSGEQKAYVNQYDTILLDLNLPDMDGLEVLDNLRNENINTPIIITTARDEVKQRALGLDMGADDYITKPFEIIELKARINAIIRRFNARVNPLIEIDNLTINPQSREIFWKNQKIELLAKEFDILEYIATKHPRVISNEEIAEHIYDEGFDPFSSVLRVHFTRLRKKLTDIIGYNIIVTTRGKGVSICIK